MLERDIDTSGFVLRKELLRKYGEAIMASQGAESFIPEMYSNLPTTVRCTVSLDLVTWLRTDFEKNSRFLLDNCVLLTRSLHNTVSSFASFWETEENYIDDSINAFINQIETGSVLGISEGTLLLAKKVSQQRESLSDDEIKQWAKSLSAQVSNASD